MLADNAENQVSQGASSFTARQGAFDGDQRVTDISKVVENKLTIWSQAAGETGHQLADALQHRVKLSPGRGMVFRFRIQGEGNRVFKHGSNAPKIT